MKRPGLWFLALVLLLGPESALSGSPRPTEETALESGTLSVFFMGEKVGYEDYSWSSDPRGFVLRASGRMTKPLDLKVESLTLALSKDFIPVEYSFSGSINGTRQEVTTKFREGEALNSIVVAGQETTSEASVRRDALILPNPLFSPYVVLAKRYACGLKDKVQVSAYMVPQVEIAGDLQSDPAAPCSFTLDLAGVQIILETDGDHHLVSISIPSQNIKVTNNVAQVGGL